MSELPALLPYLNSHERDELEELLAGMEIPLWVPQPGPQTAAYLHDADVLGYGGAAGGGKTDLLLGLALTRHQRSLILRREASKPLRAIIDRAREIVGDAGRMNENTGVWRGLPGDRQIEFGGCKDLGDEQSYRGRPHDLLCIDEADQFLEFQVRFLGGWVRTTTRGQRCRTVLAFNPPATAEGRWLLDYFGPWVDRKHPRPAVPGEIRYYATLPDGKEVERPDGEPFQHERETITPRSRSFIPARVQDNHYLMGTGYLATLQALPEPLRSQVLFGDFSAGLQDDPWQVIPTAWVEAAMARWTPQGHNGVPLSAIGVDVARGGDDQTVLAPRHGNWFARLVKRPGAFTPDGPTVIGLIAQVLQARPTALVNVDVIGVGSSVFDGCRAKKWNCLPINFAASAGNATDLAGVLTFLNLRAFAYWSTREMLDPAHGRKVALPPDRELLTDLTAPRWSMLAGGVKIESKEDIKKRIGRSTDCGDAVVMATLLPAIVAAGQGGRIEV